MKIGNALMPFVNRFPKNTELYSWMTTKPKGMGRGGRGTDVAANFRILTAVNFTVMCYNYKKFPFSM